MSRFTFDPTPLPGLVLIARQPIKDARGVFERLYCSEEFQIAGLIDPIVQINRSKTYGIGVVRGLHFQYPPFAETKIVTCTKGEIFDVAVDLRLNSPTYLHWHGEILSEANQRGLLIPKGYAHGFQTLNEDCELIYLHSSSYSASAEGAVNAMDPRIAIAWPKDITSMSERDQNHPMLAVNFKGIEV